VSVVLTACASGDDTPRAQRSAPSMTGGATVATTTTRVPTTTTAVAVPRYDAAIGVIDDAVRARVTGSWRPGCPVGPEDLRLVTLDHWGYDGQEHTGELVVHTDHAESIVRVFAALYDARFPIERMELVDVFGGDDAASTRANNTAAFNCRFVVGRPGVWSEHASGRAIDVNPLVNPYTLDPNIGQPELARYLDRAQDVVGMIQPGDAAVSAFAAEGWTWGGTWSSPDYQHFSVTGR
jgi:poly-gamma-glutamate synthesis protein (capsule biosynthesis protein)